MVLAVFSLILILSTLALVWVRWIGTAIVILSIQSLVLGLMALDLATQTGIADLYVMAGLTIVVKATAIPLILGYTMKKIGLHRATEKVIGREVSLLGGASLLVVAYVVTARFHWIQLGPLHSELPISMAMLLIGLFIMMTHQKAIMQGIGLVVMENGLFMVALVTTYGMPFFVDIGIFLDVFVAVILVSMLTYRIDQTFHSTHTENLRKLKG